MALNKMGLTAAGIAAAVGLIAGGGAIALAATPDSTTGTSQSAQGYGQSGQGGQDGQGRGRAGRVGTSTPP